MCDWLGSSRVKCIPAPYRIVDGDYIVAHPDDGRVLVLTPLVGWVWTVLEDGDWENVKLLSAEQYPDVPVEERNAILGQTVDLLRTEGLIE